MKGDTYDALSTYCEVNRVSRSGIVEQVVRQALDAEEKKIAQAVRLERIKEVAAERKKTG